MVRPVEEAQKYKKLYRPGFFGRRRDAIVADLDKKYGKGIWTLVWDDGIMGPLEFADACKYYYEMSYLNWFRRHPEEVDFICAGYSECIDNAPTNIQSGRDYTKQEAFSTHIQDIAVRNVLHTLKRTFNPSSEEILVIRSADSAGYKYGPGNIPFMRPDLIQIPTKTPRWANEGSVEAFWQSNKWVATKE